MCEGCVACRNNLFHEWADPFYLKVTHRGLLFLEMELILLRLSFWELIQIAAALRRRYARRIYINFIVCYVYLP